MIRLNETATYHTHLWQEDLHLLVSRVLRPWQPFRRQDYLVKFQRLVPPLQPLLRLLRVFVARPYQAYLQRRYHLWSQLPTFVHDSSPWRY